MMKMLSKTDPMVLNTASTKFKLMNTLSKERQLYLRSSKKASKLELLSSATKKFNAQDYLLF